MANGCSFLFIACIEGPTGYQGEKGADGKDGNSIQSETFELSGNELVRENNPNCDYSKTLQSSITIDDSSISFFQVAINDKKWRNVPFSTHDYNLDSEINFEVYFEVNAWNDSSSIYFRMRPNECDDSVKYVVNPLQIKLRLIYSEL